MYKILLTLLFKLYNIQYIFSEAPSRHGVKNSKKCNINLRFNV